MGVRIKNVGCRGAGRITALTVSSAAAVRAFFGPANPATLMGQLVWDASQRRDHCSALEYFDQAIIAARQTRDTTTEAYSQLRKSYVALYGVRDPITGLALARRAADISEQDSHVIAGLAMLHVGEAYAMLGHTDSCDQALGSAETHRAHIWPDDPAMVLYCPSQYGRLAGSCWLSLDKPAKAELALEQTRPFPQGHRKSTAIILGNLALASIRQREIDTGTARLHEAIDVVEQTRGGGGLTIMFTAARELRPWRSEHIVQDINDRIFTLMAAA